VSRTAPRPVSAVRPLSAAGCGASSMRFHNGLTTSAARMRASLLLLSEAPAATDRLRGQPICAGRSDCMCAAFRPRDPRRIDAPARFPVARAMRRQPAVRLDTPSRLWPKVRRSRDVARRRRRTRSAAPDLVRASECPWGCGPGHAAPTASRALRLAAAADRTGANSASRASRSPGTDIRQHGSRFCQRIGICPHASTSLLSM
jgi:hypothetical protein